MLLLRGRDDHCQETEAQRKPAGVCGVVSTRGTTQGTGGTPRVSTAVGILGGPTSLHHAAPLLPHLAVPVPY